MNFLLVNQYYPPDTAPTGQYLHQLARTLVARGHEVTVVCSRRAYNGTGVYPAEEILDGVRVRRVSGTGFGRVWGMGKMLDYATFYAALASRLLARSLRADVIVALTTPPYVGWLSGVAARRKGARHAHWIMDIYPDVLAANGSLSPTSWIYRLLAALTRRELSGSSVVVALCDEMAERLRGHLGQPADDRSVVQSLPLWHESALQPWPAVGAPPVFRAEQGWGERDLVLMYSGNMGRGHRLGEFLEAAQRLRQDPRVQWVFAGGGKRRGEVAEALSANPGLHARLLPYAPAERLREHLASADIHLVSLDAAWQGCMIPSKFQGIFAVGRPVLFVGGRANSLARWIEESGGGWVVPENDVEALLAAIDAARDPDERRRRGAAARAFAERRFDPARNLADLAGWLETARVGT